MASDIDFVTYVCEQAQLGPALTFRRMFGEYALYLDGKVVAFVCDNQLFLKPLAELRPLLVAAPDLQSPFPGAKGYYRLSAELDQAGVLRDLLRASARLLPPPTPKAPRKPRPKAVTPAAKNARRA